MEFKDFKLDESGLLPVIVQNYKTKKVYCFFKILFILLII